MKNFVKLSITWTVELNMSLSEGTALYADDCFADHLEEFQNGGIFKRLQLAAGNALLGKEF